MPLSYLVSRVYKSPLNCMFYRFLKHSRGSSITVKVNDAGDYRTLKDVRVTVWLKITQAEENNSLKLKILCNLFNVTPIKIELTMK
jgi:hypothetical protein